jgi:Ca2+-transporting ATPase
LAQVFRAVSSRSEHYPILKVGLFSNKWMNLAVATSVIVIFLVVYVPFLNQPFDTIPLTINQWALVLPLALMPSIIGEVSKWIF